MDMRRGFLLTILLLNTCYLSAQLRLGAKVSYTQSYVGMSEQLYDNNNDYVIYRLQLNRQQVLPSIGAVAYYEFSERFVNRHLGAFLQVEGLFNYRRTHFTFENYIANGTPPIRDYAKGVGFIRFPVLGGFEYRAFKFGVGPIFSFLISEQKVFGLYPNIDERFRTFEPAASILVGGRLDNFVLDLSYEYHFNGVSEFIYYKQRISGFKEQPHYVSLNLTYFIKSYK